MYIWWGLWYGGVVVVVRWWWPAMVEVTLAVVAKRSAVVESCLLKRPRSGEDRTGMSYVVKKGD